MIFILSLCLFALKNYLSQIKSFLLLRGQRQTKFDEAFNLFFFGFSLGGRQQQSTNKLIESNFQFSHRWIKFPWKTV